MILSTAFQPTAARDRARLSRALLCSVREDAARTIALLAAAPQLHDPFIEAARWHGVPGYAWRATCDSDVLSPERQHTLQGERYRAVAQHVQTLKDLATASAALGGADVEWLVLKGPVLAEGVHDRLGMRGYSDLDLLVRPGHLRRALEALEGAGCKTVDRNWTLLLHELRGEVHLVAPGGTVIDLHWHLINRPAAREVFALHIDELLDRRVMVDLDGLSTPALDPTDALNHLALHTMLSGGDRLVWFKDIERTLVNRPPDWDALWGRCHRQRTGLITATALRLSVDLAGATEARPLGAPPHEVSRAWLALARAVFKVSPPQRATGAGSWSRIVSRATRDDLHSSVVELSRRLLAAAMTGRMTGRAAVLSAGHPGSMTFEAGGAEARDAYLTAVAAWARTAGRARRFVNLEVTSP